MLSYFCMQRLDVSPDLREETVFLWIQQTLEMKETGHQSSIRLTQFPKTVLLRKKKKKRKEGGKKDERQREEEKED